MPLDRSLLSVHFAKWEFTHSEMATRHGIDNEPDETDWMNLASLAAEVLEPARLALGPIRVISGFRSPELNRLVRGARLSQHMRGEAADTIPLRVTLEHYLRWLADHTPFDQLILEFDSWVHVSHKRTGSQRGSILRATRTLNGATHYERMDLTALDTIA